jgi:hypothetical protein
MTPRNMALPKKQIEYRTEESEKRGSRHKMTQQLIRERGLASFMNDPKWHAVFEEIKALKLPFEIKTVLNTEAHPCHQIYELERVAVLTDMPGKFIEFWEIEQVRIQHSDRMEAFLQTMHVEFYSESGKWVVVGYR